MDFPELLAEALGPAAFSSVDRASLRKLKRLDELVGKWSRAVGLTGFSSERVRVRRYFAEALAAARWLPLRGRAIDIGSGGGSPALPLAIFRPAISWTLLEPQGRKALFLEEVIRDLSLDARVIEGRYENTECGPAEAVTLRGVKVTEATEARILASLRPGGRFLWFSAEERLERAVARGRLVGNPELTVGAPEALLAPRGGSCPRSGWLLVVEKRASG